MKTRFEIQAAGVEETLLYQYRRAVDELEALRDYSRTPNRRFDDAVEWQVIADLSGMLRKLAGEILGGEFVVRDVA